MPEIAPDGTAFELTGPGDAPVVALIHGLGLGRGMWQAHIPAFSGRYRVLSYDLYGHGDSAAAPSGATLGTFADQLARLLAHLRIHQAAVVGFSIGGMINRRLALNHAGLVPALVILNSPHDRGPAAQKAVEARARTVRDQGAMATMDEALKRWFTGEFLARNPQTADLVRAWRGRVNPESYAQAAWVLAHGVRELIAPPAPITAPTLVMTCSNDSGSTPKMSRDIAAEIQGAQTVIIPGLQHLGILEAPDLFTAPILDFLERTL